MSNENDVLLMLGKAEENFGRSTVEIKPTLSDLAEKIGSSIHAKAMIQMILFHAIGRFDQRIAFYENQEGSDEAISKRLREIRGIYEKFALMSEELPQ